MLIPTDYYYREDWQYQTIELDLYTLSIVRKQNFRDAKGDIVDSTDIININHRDWDSLFRRYGHKAYVKYLAKWSEA